MQTHSKPSTGVRRQRSALGGTLVEVLTSVAIATLTIGASVNGYILSANQAEWSAYSLAAQSLANQRLEQTRAAKWDRDATPPVDWVVADKFLPQRNELDVPISGTNIVVATNFTTIAWVSTSPPLKSIHVDCVWRFMNRGLFTNTVTSYRASDQ